MNGGADLGGMMGFGPVIEEPNEPLFHDPWEARVLGMVVALGACGKWNIDMSRFARERMQPADYMRTPYYQIWMEATVRLLIEREMISEKEIKADAMIDSPVTVKRKLEAADVNAVLFAGAPADRPPKVAAIFGTGDQVRTINNHPQTHTRLPRYARDKVGVVTKVHGCHVFPDSNSRGLGEDPQWLYKIEFSASTLWGDQGSAADTVSLDLWEPYLRRGL